MRWEHGSDFHWIEPPICKEVRPPWMRGAQTFGCGRDALRSLLKFGRDTLGWRTFWVPTYFCQTVVEALRVPGVSLRGYPLPADARELKFDGALPGDGVLVWHEFGLRRTLWHPPRPGVAIVEDHSHDPIGPAALGSRADFAVASLRKTLPLPDGAVLWSPKGRVTPRASLATKRRLRASADRLAGMVLKALYLQGQNVEKSAFRALFERGEREMAGGPPSGMSPWAAAMLQTLPMQRWRETRGKNFRCLARSLEGCNGVTVEQPEDGCTPFVAILAFDTPRMREDVRSALIQRSVYPAVLWSLESPVIDIDQRALDRSRRLLALHCDYRYDEQDMLRVAEEVATACRRASR